MSRGVRGVAQDRATLPARVAASIRIVPDFPKPGIVFRDITTLLGDADVYAEVIDALTEAYADARIDVVAGIESRGFLLGAPIAYLLRAGLLPVRKQGRLPASTISESYALEYGEAVLEVHSDAVAPGQRVLIVDDLLATGGTAGATIRLVEQLGGVVAGLAFLVELTDLNGAAALGLHRHTSLITA